MKPILMLLVCAGLGFNGHTQTPRLNSYPEADATIFLNFDGALVTGTPWNWNGPINAQPAGLTPAAMQEIFSRVAEDYRPFRINITTDSAVYRAAPYNCRTEVLVTPTSEWYGRAGGVSLVGSFSWGDGTPAWVFSALLNNNAKNIAEACSHEAGHTLGLQHQSSYTGCNKTEEYNSGRGSGEIGWAPIMGVGYSKNLTTWHTGPSSSGCQDIQDDMAVITSAANGVLYRPDDWPDTPSQAGEVRMLSQGFEVGGIINGTADVDMFRVRLQQPTRLRLAAVPQNVGAGNDGADIDIRVSILDAASDTLGIYNPSALLDAGLDTALLPGDYFIAVRGTGNANQSGYGSLGAYALAGTLLNVLPVQQLLLHGQAGNGVHLLSWSYKADESLQQLVLESSPDGRQFSRLLNCEGSQHTYACQAAGRTAWYRLKAVTREGLVSYSNVLRLSDGEGKRIRVLSTLIREEILFNASVPFPFELFDSDGKLRARGTSVPGLNRIPAGHLAPGMLLLRYSDGQETGIQKLIKQ